tara:strand:+ start:739 stop:1830 length:1092 start_codon:yes stop_codon:yes gene_type:complete
LTSSLKLIKKKVKQKESDEYKIRKQIKNSKKGTSKLNHGNKSFGPKRKKELRKKEQDTLFIGIRPSDLALKLQKESDYLIARALKGLPPPHLAYKEEKKEEDKTDKKVSNTMQSITSAKKIAKKIMNQNATGIDMPKIGEIVAVQLNGWKMEYVGVVTNIKNLEKERKNQAIKDAIVRGEGGAVIHTSNQRKMDQQQNNVDVSLLWMVDVKFDDFELSVDQKWKDKCKSRVIIDLNIEHLVKLTDSRRQRYTFMKNVWLTRQKQEVDPKISINIEKEKKQQEQTIEKDAKENLSWFEKRDRERQREMKKFKKLIQKGDNWFELPVVLDEFGFPVPEDEFSSDDEELEDDAEAPSFAILRGPRS